VSRRPSESVAARNEAILTRLRELKADHPFWGYRHCWAHLRYVDKLEVNKKRVYRLLREHGLLATQTRHAVPRASTRPKPRPDRPSNIAKRLEFGRGDIAAGFAQADVIVETARAAELLALMPFKAPPDTSKFLLSPMPGLLTQIAVTPGQEVKAGEVLAKIEAMKMENVLKAERDCVVDKLLAVPGESLAVDQAIIGFK